MTRAPEFKLPSRLERATWVGGLDRSIGAQGDGHPVQVNTSVQLQALYRLEGLAKQLGDLKTPLAVEDEFYSPRTRLKAGPSQLPRVKRAGQQARIYGALQQFHEAWGNLLLQPDLARRISFAPSIQAFREAFEDLGTGYDLKPHIEHSPQDVTPLTEEINTRLKYLQKRLRERREDEKKRLQVTRKRQRTIHDHLSSYLRHHGQLLVIRLELGVISPYIAQDFPSHPDFHVAAAIEQLETLFQYLLPRRKPPHEILRNRIGYLVKRQLLPDKGPHLHLILLFDGNRYTGVTALEDAIATCWHQLAAQRGLQSACWGARKPGNGLARDARALDVLEWRKAAHRQCLQDLACYLGELDYYNKLEPPDNRNDLRHTHAPRQQGRHHKDKKPLGTKN